MRFCFRCRHFSGGGPLCTHCGRSFGGRLCRGRTRHLNPYDAVFCNHCGTSDLTEGATSLPLGWFSRLLIFGLVLWLGRILLSTFAHVSNWSFQGLTGYQNIGVWLVEKFAHVLVLLFVFYFLSSFMPGETGKQFRAAMFGIVTHAIKLFFKVLEQILAQMGKLFLRAFGIESETKKKKKH